MSIFLPRNFLEHVFGRKVIYFSPRPLTDCVSLMYEQNEPDKWGNKLAVSINCVTPNEYAYCLQYDIRGSRYHSEIRGILTHAEAQLTRVTINSKQSMASYFGLIFAVFIGGILLFPILFADSLSRVVSFILANVIVLIIDFSQNRRNLQLIKLVVDTLPSE